uniref:EamA domain-containing protein n=1 Tax=Lotharella globosa TaxID=91324 RepID=A0A7S3ZF01_9EUKA|mmetsp:Transcript_20717/g.40005  ORF Transcript_20717/g.40005 Transcript_20717/m.40005 type:complete len:389 (+) Transcript_20717:139-1305(+)
MVADAVFWTALLAIQCGVQPDLTSNFASKQVINTSAVIVQEGILKVVLGVQALLFTGETAILKAWSFRESIKVAGVPALLYAVQNLLTYIAFANLDGLSYNIINQSKLIWNALLVWIFLGERLTWDQVLSLGIIIFTTLLVTTDPEKMSASETDQNGGGSYALGVGYTLMASAISGVASTLIQYNLQKLRRNSYLMSAELGFYSACYLAAKVACEAYLGYGDGLRILKTSFFHGFSNWTLVPLASTACGGIVVGQVTKHLGGVGKAYALLLGIIFSAYLHAEQISWRLGLAVPLIILAFWLKFRKSIGPKQPPPTSSNSPRKTQHGKKRKTSLAASERNGGYGASSGGNSSNEKKPYASIASRTRSRRKATATSAGTSTTRRVKPRGR